MRNRQNGFTLIEILLVMAVGGMLLSGLVTAIFQTFGVTKMTTTAVSALENIKMAAYQITQDVKTASTTNLVDGAPAVSNLSLYWTIWYDANGNLIPNGEPHSSQYTLSETNLQRNLDGTSIKTVARYISSVQFSRQGNMIAVSITSSPQGKPETAENKTYYIYLQPKESPMR